MLAHLASCGGFHLTSELNLQAAALLFLLVCVALSIPRRRPPGAGKRTPTARPAESAKHHCECMCRLCEVNGTGAFAMREADGDYERFLGLVETDTSGR